MSSSNDVESKVIPKQAGEAGLGLFATCSITPGEDVLILSKNFVNALDSARLADTCSSCFYSRGVFNEATPNGRPREVRLMNCSGCRVVKYCCKGCQTTDWTAAHKYECAIYKELHPRILPVNARAVLRIVLLTKSKKPEVRQTMERLLPIESHLREISQAENKEQYERIVLTAKAVREYSKTNLDFETVMQYCAKLEINSFALVTPFSDRLGLCIHPLACYMNHSCQPNAAFSFSEGRIFVKALEQINDSDQIFISYIDTTSPFKRRQEELSERYFFQCKCPKCLMGENAREDQFLKNSSLDLPVLNIAEQKALSLFAEAKSADSETTPEEQLKSAIRILGRTRVWPPTRQPSIQIRDELIVSLREAGKLWEAFMQSMVRYLRVDPVIFPQDWHPIRSVHSYLAIQILDELLEGTTPTHLDPNVPNEIRDVHIGRISYSILSELVRNSSKELPSIGELYRTKFEHMKGVLQIGGIVDPSSPASQRQTKIEWMKIRAMVDRMLERETLFQGLS